MQRLLLLPVRPDLPSDALDPRRLGDAINPLPYIAALTPGTILAPVHHLVCPEVPIGVAEPSPE